MKIRSLLENHRLHYQPTIPRLLQDFTRLVPFEMAKVPTTDREVAAAFPLTINQPILSFKSSETDFSRPLKVGVVFSGGQAPGGHNVIAGLYDALNKLNRHSQLIGFLGGPQGLIENQFRILEKNEVDLYRNLGGFDLLGSGRTKIETEPQFEAVEKTLKEHSLDGLVIVGGDDSNTNAAFLAEYCRSKEMDISIVGVPKTIDGDLKNTYIEASFGFDTACKVYSESVGNLLTDSLSAKKYYFFVKMMGRSASHITLECALQTHVNLALIGEEVSEGKKRLADIVSEIADLVCVRSEIEKNYGVILIPEGLLEFIPEFQTLIESLNALLAKDPSLSAGAFLEKLKVLLPSAVFDCFEGLPKEIQQQFLLERDSHGNVQLAKVETERLLIALVELELKKRSLTKRYDGKFSAQPLYLGYEGRSAMPSNFDCNYCYSLGLTACLLILHKKNGVMAVLQQLTSPVQEWIPQGIPLSAMIDFEMRAGKRKAVIKKALVDLKGGPFLEFAKKRQDWKVADDYLSPGPIQFEGPPELTNQPTLTLVYEQ